MVATTHYDEFFRTVTDEEFFLSLRKKKTFSIFDVLKFNKEPFQIEKKWVIRWYDYMLFRVMILFGVRTFGIVSSALGSSNSVSGGMTSLKQTEEVTNGAKELFYHRKYSSQFQDSSIYSHLGA